VIINANENDSQYYLMFLFNLAINPDSSEQLRQRSRATRLLRAINE
jgi:hypothetical protein